MQSNICRGHVCSTIICHLHFWQNDKDLLLATAVTRGWKWYQNQTQHRKVTLDKKIHPNLDLSKHTKKVKKNAFFHRTIQMLTCKVLAQMPLTQQQTNRYSTTATADLWQLHDVGAEEVEDVSAQVPKPVLVCQDEDILVVLHAQLVHQVVTACLHQELHMEETCRLTMKHHSLL